MSSLVNCFIFTLCTWMSQWYPLFTFLIFSQSEFLQGYVNCNFDFFTNTNIMTRPSFGRPSALWAAHTGRTWRVATWWLIHHSEKGQVHIIRGITITITYYQARRRTLTYQCLDLDLTNSLFWMFWRTIFLIIWLGSIKQSIYHR